MIGASRAGLGANQYRAGPSRMLAAAGDNECPGLLVQARSTTCRCGGVWGSKCQAWVGPPHWGHGKHPSPQCKWAAARLPGTPPEVLASLAGDPDFQVREGVAAHPNCPSDVLARFSESGDGMVRRAVAGNPSSPLDLLAGLGGDSSAGVRIGVASNPGCSPVLLRQVERGQ